MRNRNRHSEAFYTNPWFLAIVVIAIGVFFIIKCESEKINKITVTQPDPEHERRSAIIRDSIKHITDSIANLEHIKTIKSSIRVKSCYLSPPNSAGGCDANFYYVNKSVKTIKYLVFDASFENNVGDLVTCDIRRDASFRGKDTGPVKTGRSSGGVWDCAIYNWSATKLVINSIDIEYMEGGTITISGEDLKLVGLKERQIHYKELDNL